MGRIRHKVVEGKRCSSCGRTQRFAADRRCVFCANWAAYDTGNWRLILDLGQDYRTRERSRRSRNRRRAVEGRVTADEARDLLTWQEGCCTYCDETTNLHLDHVVPVSRGGTGWWWNLQWLCRAHNLAKGSRTDAEYRSDCDIALVHPPKRAVLLVAMAIPV